MEQRNELLRQMKLTERSRRGTMQNLLARSFSRKEIPIFTPLSPTDISIAVPQFPQATPTVSQATPTKQAVTEGDALSIGELSVEPRLLGVAENETRGQQLIDLSSPQPHHEEETSLPSSHSPPSRRESAPTRDPPRSSSPPLRASLPSHGSSKASLPSRGSTPSKASSRKPSPPTRVRKDSASSSDSSCPEEQSVRTPLLDGEVPTVTLPVITQPTIASYDHLFTDGVGEEIPLGGTADTINNQP